MNNSCRNIPRVYAMQKNNGFTLIEVLIALAILGIALTAIIHATSQNIRDTSYLQTKTTATWVATQVMNEARSGVLKIAEGEDTEQVTEMLNRNWPWFATLTPTPNSHIKKITVKVYKPSLSDNADSINKDEQDPITQLESYIYVQP